MNAATTGVSAASISSPVVENTLSFSAASKPFAIEQLVAQFSVEAFHHAVLPWIFRRLQSRVSTSYCVSALTCVPVFDVSPSSATRSGVQSFTTVRQPSTGRLPCRH